MVDGNGGSAGLNEQEHLAQATVSVMKLVVTFNSTTPGPQHGNSQY